LRLLQVIPDFGLGGIQKAGCVLAEAMMRAGHQVLLCGDGPGPRFQASCSGHRLLGSGPKALADIARHFAPDVIHLHAPEYPEDLIRSLATEPRDKVPLLVTTPVFGRPPADRGILKLTRTCCVGVFTFYRLGRWLRQLPQEMVGNGIGYVPLTPFQPPPAEVDRATERGKLGITEDSFVFGRVGRTQGGKWHPCYPRIIDTVLSTEPKAQWVSIGFPEELGRANLQQRWGSRFRDFPETSDYQFLAATLAVMDVQLFWSQHGECFAATICEAAGMGTPTVAGVNPCQDNGQSEQVLDGVTGELVGTPSQAIAALHRLAADRSLLQVLRDSTRKHAWTRWHVDRVAADLCDLYEYWLSGKECAYLATMVEEHEALMRNYRRQIAGLLAQSSLRYSAWEMALWSAESWPLFAGVRHMKPYVQKLLGNL